MTAIHSSKKTGGKASTPLPAAATAKEGWKPYPAYKPSGVEWLGDVPDGWAVKRLKTSATCWVSNVDKVPADDELPVRLCNYTDVYYNDHITPDMGLMETTATANEIRRFGLLVGDVVITKDSEEWSDIAVPALVKQSAPDLVCGYHLAIIRSHANKLYGDYLLRTFQSCAVNQQFQIAASGVTRYGLPKASIGDAWIPIPTPAEQRAIAEFLDRETGKIDRLVAKKRELIGKLKEERAALISRAVTRGLPSVASAKEGLNPNAKMKPSGIEWLGDVPEHWNVPPLYTRFAIELGKMLNEGRITGEHLVPYLRNTDVQWDKINLDDLPEMDISPRERARYTVNAGDLLVCEGGESGRAAIFPAVDVLFGFQKALHRMRPLNDTEIPRFMFYVLNWAVHAGIFAAEGNPNTIPHLTGENLRRYRFPRPSLLEQRAIADFLDRETGKIDRLGAKVEEAIARLQEYRAALITAAVTGKIDVRAAAGMGKRLEYPEPQPELLMAAEANGAYGGRNAGKKNTERENTDQKHTDGHGQARTHTRAQAAGVRARPCPSVRVRVPPGRPHEY